MVNGRDLGCTLGIKKESLNEKGILELLRDNNIETLEEVRIPAVGKRYPIEGSGTTSSDLGLTIGRTILVYASGILHDVKTQDLIDDLIRHELGADREVKEVTYKDPLNSHLYTLERQKKKTYRVSAIDGETVLGSFTKEEIIEYYYGSSFENMGTMMCNIRTDKIQKKTIVCDPEPIKHKE